MQDEHVDRIIDELIDGELADGATLETLDRDALLDQIAAEIDYYEDNHEIAVEERDDE